MGQPHSFLHRPSGGHLGYLQVLVVTNKAANEYAMVPQDGGSWPENVSVAAEFKTWLHTSVQSSPVCPGLGSVVTRYKLL